MVATETFGRPQTLRHRQRRLPPSRSQKPNAAAFPLSTGSGSTRAFIDGYLDAIEGPVDYADGGQALLRWRRPPVIKYSPGFARSSLDAVEGLRIAVSMINHGMPREMQVKWGGALGAELHTLTEADAEGLIIVGVGNLQGLGSGITLGSARDGPVAEPR